MDVHVPIDLFGRDEAVVIQIILAEISKLLTAVSPFVQRDLAIVVRVEGMEPRREGPGDGLAAIRRGALQPKKRRSASRSSSWRPNAY